MRKRMLIKTLICSAILISGCSKSPSTIQLEESIDVLIVLKEKLRIECKKEVKKSCEQMNALVDTIDLLVVQEVSVSHSAKGIAKMWVESHRYSNQDNERTRESKRND